MIPEIIRYRIPAASAENFVRDYRLAGAALKQSEHCHGFDLVRSAKDPELFMLTIHWDSSDGHMSGFRRSPQFTAFFAHVKPYLDNILEMEHYIFTEVSWRRDA